MNSAAIICGPIPAPNTFFSKDRGKMVAVERNQFKLRSREHLASQIQLVAGKHLNLLLYAVA